MPFEPLRFLHAANLRLDHAIAETVTLPPRVERIVQDATLAAFDRLIAAAIDRSADFVLLTGNTFVETDQSLTARLVLRDGFERLAREAIRVYVLPGALDPASAWRKIPDLPGNVTVIDENQKSPLGIKRGETLIARLGPSARLPGRKASRAAQRELRSESQRPVPFAIGLLAAPGDLDDQSVLSAWCDGQDEDVASPSESAAAPERPIDKLVDSPVDYLALGGSHTRRTIAKRKGIAHDPGPLQGTGPWESGPKGCTFVDVEADGTVRCEFLPTASVRWERFSVQMAGDADQVELVRRCRALLREARWEENESAWILEWVLRGATAALAPFGDETYCRQVQQELNEEVPVASGETVVHKFAAEVADAAPPVAGDPLHAQFVEALAACRQGGAAAFRRCLADVASADREWGSRLEGLLSELDAESIGRHARRILDRQCQPAAEGDSR